MLTTFEATARVVVVASFMSIRLVPCHQSLDYTKSIKYCRISQSFSLEINAPAASREFLDE